MKVRLRYISLAVFFLFCANANAEPFLQQTDKQEHIAGSGLVTLIAASAFRKSSHPILYGSLVGLAVGVGKELYDRRQPGNKFSAPDVAADSLGIAAGGLIFRIEF